MENKPVEENQEDLIKKRQEEREERKNAQAKMSLTHSDSDSTSEEGGEEQVSWVAVKDVGEAEDRNSKFRRTMEDAHVCIDSFGGDKNAFFWGV